MSWHLQIWVVTPITSGYMLYINIVIYPIVDIKTMISTPLNINFTHPAFFGLTSFQFEIYILGLKKDLQIWWSKQF